MPDQATSPPKFVSQSIRITIKGGLDTKKLFPKSRHNGSVAESAIITKPSISRVALLGRDYPNTRFDIVADQGTTVIAGDPVLRDRKRPEIYLSSPVSGTITAIKRGPRRSLASLEIGPDNQQQRREFDLPAHSSAKDIRQLLLQSGLWATLRTRPFGHIPEPSQSPAALFITAMDTRPLAVEPTRVISSYERQFNEGLTALGQLVDCPIYLCQKPGAGLSNVNTGRITVAEFDGLHPAGLPGTHIHHLCPVGAGDREVWHIDYQDVISVGHLMQHNSPWFDRVVSLCGNGFKTPRLLLLPIGSSVSDAVQSELIDEPSRIMTGSPLFADAIGSDPAFLGLGQRQITAFRETESNNGWFPTSKATLIPTTDLDQLVPDGILAVPLLRALETADTDRARELGALELIEEDLALLGYASNTNIDYGPLLRAVLDQISREGLSTPG
jgi:Na+-transporting NADH:ubiquinone oxidoreductase subunit A